MLYRAFWYQKEPWTRKSENLYSNSDSASDFVNWFSQVIFSEPQFPLLYNI